MRKITIGRNSSNDIVINDTMVSRFHCEIIQESGRIKIVDLNSSNGTFVNGQRIYGTIYLNPQDVVCVHNTPVNWQKYFTMPQAGTHTSLKKVLLPIFVLLGVALVATGVFFLLKKINEPKSIAIEVGMTLNEIKNMDNTTVILHHAPSYESEICFIKSFDYYLINNNTAAKFDNDRVVNIYTWDPSYRTDNGLSVNSTLGEVLRQYSTSMSCWYECVAYNYISQQYEAVFYLYDTNSCTTFAFLASQLTSQQSSAILATSSVADDMGGYVYLSQLSSTMLQSISSSVSVSWIERSDCNKQILEPKDTPTEPVKTEPKTPTLRTAKYYIKFGDSETYELSDGSKVSASLTTMGLGDLRLNISWYGKTPTKLSWTFDGNRVSPMSNVLYSKKNGDSYSLRESIWFDLDWSNGEPTINGVNFTIYPISEEDRKYNR